MAKMLDLLEMWLESPECPLQDTRYKLSTGERDAKTPSSDEITDVVIENFRNWCDGCASEVLPDKAAENMIAAYKDYLIALEKPGHEGSFGDNEWFQCVASDKVSDVEIRTTWEDIRLEEKTKKKSKDFCR